MKALSLFGLIIAGTVVLIGMRLTSDNMAVFFDWPSLFIVLGGTFAATAITFRIDQILNIFKIFITHITRQDNFQFANLVAEIMKVSDSYRKGESLDSHIQKVKDPFFKEALELINDGVLEHDHLMRILDDRVNNLNYLRNEDAQKIRTLGQFPPAFGMMGTTIGMIVLLANLGGEDAIKKIGPAMGVCLITTLYGVIIANLGFIPVAENLTYLSKRNNLKNVIIVEGVRLLLEKVNPVILAEELNSYLKPDERLNWKEVIGS